MSPTFREGYVLFLLEERIIHFLQNFTVIWSRISNECTSQNTPSTGHFLSMVFRNSNRNNTFFLLSTMDEYHGIYFEFVRIVDELIWHCSVQSGKFRMDSLADLVFTSIFDSGVFEHENSWEKEAVSCFRTWIDQVERFLMILVEDHNAELREKFDVCRRQVEEGHLKDDKELEKQEEGKEQHEVKNL